MAFLDAFKAAGASKTGEPTGKPEVFADIAILKRSADKPSRAVPAARLTALEGFA
ncbi:hypothetical protein CSIRO_0352 [Bradyrhizobiaceae bacterium SG-6C]|nr:hypothetical protein CSIRO_0352 [Bradyrhizobiaceae bacterium SG-6C]